MKTTKIILADRQLNAHCRKTVMELISLRYSGKFGTPEFLSWLDSELKTAQDLLEEIITTPALQFVEDEEEVDQ